MGILVFLGITATYLWLSARSRAMALAGAAVLLPFEQYLPSLGVPLGNIHTLIMVGLLWGMVRTPTRRLGQGAPKLPAAVPLFGLVIVIAFLQALFAEGPSLRLFLSVKGALCTLYIFLAAFRIADNAIVSRTAFWGAVAGVGAETLFCFVEFMTRSSKVTGHLVTRNATGAFLATYAAFFFGVYLVSPKDRRRRLFLLLAGAGAIATLGTRSRGGVLALAATLFLVSLWRNRALFVLLLVLALSYQLWMPQTLLGRFDMAVEETQDGIELAGTLASRLTIWKAGFRAFRDYPFGVGLDRFGPVVVTYDDETEGRNAHNEFIMVLVEFGLHGLFVYVWLLVRLAVGAWRTYRRDADAWLRRMGFGALVGLLGSLAASMALTLVTRADISGTLWILLAVCARRAAATRGPLKVDSRLRGVTQTDIRSNTLDAGSTARHHERSGSTPGPANATSPRRH